MFEYEHAEKQRIRQEQADEVTVGQAEGGSRKKSRTDAAEHILAGPVRGRLMMITDSVTTR